MDRKHLFVSLKEQILQTRAYQAVPYFPGEVQRAKTLEHLIWWIGTTNFSTSPLGGEFAALLHLSFIHYAIDDSHSALMSLVFFITNLDTPGLFVGHERENRDRAETQTISYEEVSTTLRDMVKGRPYLRKAVAQYIIFEHNIAGYEALTLAELAVRVEQEYKWEYGDSAFVSSTRDVANALAHTESERESLRKMLIFALEIGTHHIRSRLAVNWLAQVQLRDPKLRQALSRLKQMTLKAIWQQKMQYTTDDTEFLDVLRRGGTLEDLQN